MTIGCTIVNSGVIPLVLQRFQSDLSAKIKTMKQEAPLFRVAEH